MTKACLKCDGIRARYFKVVWVLLRGCVFAQWRNYKSNLNVLLVKNGTDCANDFTIEAFESFEYRNCFDIFG